jgi:hypothetical protein
LGGQCGDNGCGGDEKRLHCLPRHFDWIERSDSPAMGDSIASPDAKKSAFGPKLSIEPLCPKTAIGGWRYRAKPFGLLVNFRVLPGGYGPLNFAALPWKTQVLPQCDDGGRPCGRNHPAIRSEWSHRAENRWPGHTDRIGSTLPILRIDDGASGWRA